METKSWQAQKEHNHTGTPNLTRETIQCREKNHEVVVKKSTMKIEITTLKFMPNLSSQ